MENRRVNVPHFEMQRVNMLRNVVQSNVWIGSRLTSNDQCHLERVERGWQQRLWAVYARVCTYKH